MANMRAALFTLSTITKIFCVLANLLAVSASSLDEGLLVVTVATEETDGFKRLLRSTNKYDLDVKVVGMGKDWLGGDVAVVAGGGQKVNLLRDALAEYKDRDDLVLMFVDSYDVVFTNGTDAILEKFHKFDARVVFSAESFCWPKVSLADKYPPVKVHEKRYLNSGGYMGYAKEIIEILNHRSIKNADDDQLYFTQIFLMEDLRKKFSMKLDTKGEIFQNLNGALGDVSLKFKGSRSYMYNIKTGTVPIVIHGNGPIKPEFNRLSHYLADSWTTSSGCLACQEDTFSLKGLKDDDYPSILIGLFIERPTPFVREFLQRVGDLDYPKQKIDVYIHLAVEIHENEVVLFVSNYDDQYNSMTLAFPEDKIPEAEARNWALDMCVKKNCQYYLSVDSIVQLTNPDTLVKLIEQNRTVLAPLVIRPGKLWSNFWGALNHDGYYARSEDYVDIVDNSKIGLWNVPYVSQVYLIHGHTIPGLINAFTSSRIYTEPDMSFCEAIRSKGTFMHVSNREDFGHLVYNDDYDTTHLNNDIYQIAINQKDWEHRYLHADYASNLDLNKTLNQPCPDVFWFPIFTPQFCKELIAEAEHYGQWSGGKNEDARLAGGYENVPTVDIHMNQIGFEEQWLHFLKVYISPVQQRAYEGYYSDPPRSIMNFMVRYRPDEQPLLRPHHDSSTFTINMALNEKHVEFEGGGCHFIRYNCKMTDTRVGWTLMHPGRLTHYHEGLRVTNGTRYIMVSFIDP